jgi:hypothetical protein
MVWSAVADKQTISYNTLQEACDALIFLKIGNIPAPGKTGNQMIPAEQIQSLVEIEPAPLVGVPNNELVVKEQVIPVTRTYYQLTPCGSGGIAWTRIFPTSGFGQRYILFGGTNLFWYYSGISVGPQTSIPSGYNGSIQRVTGATFCP